MAKKGLDKMLYDINNIDINRLKDYKLNLSQEESNFKNKTYSTFQLSYLNNSNDVYIKNMMMNLDAMYSSINKSYIDIISYLNSYIDNMLSLEATLSNNSSSNLIPDSTLRNYASSKLSNLPKERFIIK